MLVIPPLLPLLPSSFHTSLHTITITIATIITIIIPSASLPQGLSYAALGEYPLAISAYIRGLSIDPSSSDLLCNLGLAYKERGDANSSERTFARAVQAHPK